MSICFVGIQPVQRTWKMIPLSLRNNVPLTKENLYEQSYSKPVVARPSYQVCSICEDLLDFAARGRWWRRLCDNLEPKSLYMTTVFSSKTCTFPYWFDLTEPGIHISAGVWNICLNMDSAHAHLWDSVFTLRTDLKDVKSQSLRMFQEDPFAMNCTMDRWYKFWSFWLCSLSCFPAKAFMILYNIYICIIPHLPGEGC